MKKQKKQKQKKNNWGFKLLLHQLELIPRMLIGMVVLYIIGQEVELSLFQQIIIQVSMTYWIMKPIFYVFKRIFK